MFRKTRRALLNVVSDLAPAQAVTANPKTGGAACLFAKWHNANICRGDSMPHFRGSYVIYLTYERMSSR
jgi:hypothetical protein